MYESGVQDKAYSSNQKWTADECKGASYQFTPDGMTMCTSVGPVETAEKAKEMCDQLPGCNAVDYLIASKYASYKKSADVLVDKPGGWVSFKRRNLAPVYITLGVIAAVAAVGCAVYFRRRR